jgi:hypothetical protein
MNTSFIKKDGNHEKWVSTEPLPEGVHTLRDGDDDELIFSKGSVLRRDIERPFFSYKIYNTKYRLRP